MGLLSVYTKDGIELRRKIVRKCASEAKMCSQFGGQNAEVGNEYIYYNTCFFLLRICFFFERLFCIPHTLFYQYCYQVRNN